MQFLWFNYGGLIIVCLNYSKNFILIGFCITYLYILFRFMLVKYNKSITKLYMIE
jgi:hypothetical protein